MTLASAKEEEGEWFTEKGDGDRDHDVLTK